LASATLFPYTTLFRSPSASWMCRGRVRTPWPDGRTMPAADGAADLAQAWRTFTDPPADARPMMRWWWFGPDVEREELERELTARSEEHTSELQSRENL